jgi:hypothetical protein
MLATDEILIDVDGTVLQVCSQKHAEENPSPLFIVTDIIEEPVDSLSKLKSIECDTKPCTMFESSPPRHQKLSEILTNMGCKSFDKVFINSNTLDQWMRSFASNSICSWFTRDSGFTISSSYDSKTKKTSLHEKLTHCYNITDTWEQICT